MEPTDASGAARALRLTRMLRATILVVCLGVATGAWMLDARTVAALAIVIALEETWETSVVVAALRRQVGGAPVPHRWPSRT